MINDSELILNKDGSIYHLNLMPEDIADTIITVGDPDRVEKVSQHFDRIEFQKGKREFITHTGFIGNKRISVISTGIGTDNIDIVFNELDALVNIDFESKALKSRLTSLNIIRIGTSGAIQSDIEMGTILASSFGVGFDALMQYYVKPYSNYEKTLERAVWEAFPNLYLKPYVAEASASLLAQYAYDLPKGVTMTAPGFYAPQGRNVRSENTFPNLIQMANTFKSDGLRITNLEMETAGIYALSRMFGHQALSINAILASRVAGHFSSEPDKVVDRAIKLILERF